MEFCDSDGGSVLVANYTSGSVAAFPVAAGGSGALDAATDSKQAAPMLPLDPALADRQERYVKRGVCGAVGVRVCGAVRVCAVQFVCGCCSESVCDTARVCAMQLGCVRCMGWCR